MEQVKGGPGNVYALTIKPPSRIREPAVTDAEIAEFRRLKPLLLRMLKEWEQLKSEEGCPVARHVLPP